VDNDINTVSGAITPPLSALAWHPVHEGLFVSGGGDGSLGYWLVNTDKELALLEQAHDQTIWCVEWHPLGHILATGGCLSYLHIGSIESVIILFRLQR